MKLLIHQIKCNINQTLTKREIAKKLKCSESDIYGFTIHRRSLDARNGLKYSYSVIADVKKAQRYLRQIDVQEYMVKPFHIPMVKTIKSKPVVIGFGPSGIFAALVLAKAGYKPLVFEMGQAMEERITSVDTFLSTKKLNPKSNVQYGEGGAGTFSDGKLTCRIKDERIPWILEQFVTAGAPSSIVYDALPHLGTDQLRLIIPRLRQMIMDLGGEVHFNSELNNIDVVDGHIKSIRLNDAIIDTDTVFLCTGHSNHGLYQMLFDRGITIVQKDTAIGVRIEHPQPFIDQTMYHQYASDPLLPAASYHLAASDNGIGIYTFCMCPGGVIMASNANEDTIVTNGMSYSKRDGEYANAALLVQLSKDQYGSNHPLAGFDYLYQLERKAFELGGHDYKAPGISVKEFYHQTTYLSDLSSTYPFGIVPTHLEDLFGQTWCNHVRHALTIFDKKMHGYIHDDARMIAIESKSSSPIRVLRDPTTLQSVSTKGFYPCGEGAGYAGGIISSALDGVKSALRFIAEQYT